MTSKPNHRTSPLTIFSANLKTLTKNIRERRGANVNIERPKFLDAKTRISSENGGSSSASASSDRMIHADAMSFGMGCSALQVTFQAANLGESRHLYDHLGVLTPIMMALTAATPYLRGWLQAEDVRWSIVAESVDDRTAAERGRTDAGPDSTGVMLGDPRLAGNGVKRLRKSRYGGIDCYISPYTGTYETADEMAEAHNDTPLVFEPRHMERLLLAGIDTVLARHVAHLFCRDPLVIFEDRVLLNDRADVDHWENIQSTNWQSVRWKPPHPERGKLEVTSERHVGWRVEFRSMELQITDFENAAFTVFVVLISRVLLTLELNLYVPLSKLEENMKTAHKMDAVTAQKFWFRKNLLPNAVTRQIESKRRGAGADAAPASSSPDRGPPAVAFEMHEASDGSEIDSPLTDRNEQTSEEDLYEKMTIKEILLGKDCYNTNASGRNNGNDAKTREPDACGGGGPCATSPSTGECHFPGLIPLIRTYLDFIGVDSVTAQKLNDIPPSHLELPPGPAILDFIVARASGELPTNAQWIRNFIRAHPSYKGDSKVPEDAAYDLLLKAKRIGEGEEHCPDLLGDFKIDRCHPASNPFKLIHGEAVFDEANPMSPRVLSRAVSAMHSGRPASDAAAAAGGAGSDEGTPGILDLDGLRESPPISFQSKPCMEVRKREMLDGYLQRAKIRRDIALKHALRKKTAKMNEYAAEVAALQKDLNTSKGVSAGMLPKGLSAQTLVEASAEFSNRPSYRISLSPNSISRAVSQEPGAMGLPVAATGAVVGGSLGGAAE
eukprot:g5841.t1